MPTSLLTVTPLTASGISHVFDNIPYGAALWLDATKISGVTSGTSLSVWTDLSATGSHVSHSLVTRQPLYVNNIINGLPGVRFDGTNTFLGNSVPSVITQAPATIFFVSTSSNTNATRELAHSANLRWGESGSPVRFTVIGVADVIGNSILTQGTPVTVSIVFDSGLTVSFYRNGSLSSALGVAGNPTNSSGMAVGATNAGTSPWPGDIGELLLYRTALSATARQQVESYLTNKWGTV